MDAATLNEAAGKAPDIAGVIKPEVQPDTIKLSERRPFVVQFKANGNLTPKGYNVCVLATSETEAAADAIVKTIGCYIGGELMEHINVYGVFPAQIPPLLA